MKAALRLRVVDADGSTHEPEPLDPADDLRRLFKREAAAKRRLGTIQEELQAARKRYGKAEDLLALPHIDRLRTMFGGDQ